MVSFSYSPRATPLICTCKTFLFVGVILSLCAPWGHGKITFMIYPDWPSQNSLPNPYWVFDYVLQQLTVIGDIYRVPSRPGVPGQEFTGGSIPGLYGDADSDSVFQVTAVFRNKTDITWTDFRVVWGAVYVTGNTPFQDIVFVSSSKFSTSERDVPPVTLPNILLSGPPAVLPNEVFTINMDVYVGQGRFYDDLLVRPIPEPATVVLLALGSIGLARRRRTESNREV